jgi:uncharacterized integral membrane protein
LRRAPHAAVFQIARPAIQIARPATAGTITMHMSDVQQTPKRRRTRHELARTGAFVVLAVLITLFAVLNVKEVKVNWIFGTSNAPLIVVIVVSLLVGILLTYIAEQLHRRTR